MVAESTTMTRQTFSPRATIAAPPLLPATGHHSCSRWRNGSLRIFLVISSCSGAIFLLTVTLPRKEVERDTGHLSTAPLNSAALPWERPFMWSETRAAWWLAERRAYLRIPGGWAEMSSLQVGHHLLRMVNSTFSCQTCVIPTALV